MDNPDDDAGDDGALPIVGSPQHQQARDSLEHEQARDNWLREARRNARKALFLGVALFALVHLLAAVGLIFAGVEPPAPDDSLWTLFRDIAAWFRRTGEFAGADATVLVTAMVLLVATLNVAVIASTWRSPAMDADHIHTNTWVEIAKGVAMLAGAIAVAVALMALFVSVRLGISLLGVAVLTVVIAAATLPRLADWAPATFRLAEARLQAEVADRKLSDVLDRWRKIESVPPEGLMVRLVALIALPPIVSAIVATSAAFTAADGSEPAPIGALMMTFVFAFLLTIVPTSMTVSLWIAKQRNHPSFRSIPGGVRGVRRWPMHPIFQNTTYMVTLGIWALPFLILFTGVSVGIAVTALITFVIVPVGLPLLILRLGRSRGWRPGLWGAQWVVRELEDGRDQAHAERKRAEEQLAVAQIARAQADSSRWLELKLDRVIELLDGQTGPTCGCHGKGGSFESVRRWMRRRPPKATDTAGDEAINRQTQREQHADGSS